MIEKLLCIGTGFRTATQANALFERSIDQFALRRDLENLFESGFDRRLVNLLQPKIAFQSLPADWPLLHAQRRVAVRKPRVVHIAILTQPLDNLFNDRLRRAAPFEQALSELLDGPLFGSEQLAGPLKHARALFLRIERFWLCFVRLLSSLSRLCVPRCPLW